MLRAAGVGFGYGLVRRTEVFTDLDWAVPPGRRTVLLGPNGAGKSTLLKLLAGYLQPRSGEIVRPRDADGSVRVGWMPQDITAIRGLTVLEQVTYAGWLTGMSRSSATVRARDALATVLLAGRADARAASLSGGQLRRLGLAEALAVDVDVLLLDEPTAGLDPAQRGNFREIVRSIPEDVAVVVSTHQVDDLDDLFQHVTVLADGTITFDGPVAGFRGLAEELGVPDGSVEQIFSALVRGGLH